jgi:very-short-patch-repair endonuclease
MSMQSINLTLLGALHAAQDVHDLFRQLGYPVETPDAFIGDDLDALDLDPADRANVVRAYIVARLHMHTVYLYEVHDLRTTRLRSLAWNILQRGTGLLIVTTPAERGEYREILFVDPRFAGRPVKSAVRVNKLRVVTAEPTRHDLDTLNAIHAHRRTGQQVYDAQGAAFNVTTVTKRFYDEYRGHYERAKAAIQKANPGVRDFYDADKLHAFTQRLLGRLMFLYFLQRKGWLGGRTRFLTERYTALQRQHAGETHDGETYYYYRDVLEPLFFQTLNTKRPGDITRWEGIRIPYLNGGLFDEARDPAGPILIPDSLFDPNDVNGLLGFFNRYNFTIADDTPLEQDVAVDPEMLGKVFENLLEERDRGQSGSFYTPRSIVSYMCQEALAGYLEESAGIARETTRALFDPDADAHLTPDQAIRMNAALDTLTVLDPAVGSGSFLIGMMNEILRLRLACHDALTPKSPLPQQVGERGLGDHALRERGLGDHALRERGLGDHALRERGLGDHALRERGLEDHALEETGLEDREQWHITPQMRARMTAIARTLRKNATPSEDMLWQALRNRQLDDRKFKRQVDIGAFILDFYCAKERLAVEVDGAIHDSQQDADRERQSLIESLGIRFVRVKAEEVEQNLPAVLNKIRAAFLPSPHEGVGEGSGVRAELPSPREAVGEGSGVRAELPSPREGVGEGSGVRAELITAWKEAIIRDTLYGVDIKPEAIEIAQLRLWLALVVDQTLEQARPLPNLDYKLMAGDSLIETLDGEPVLTESAAALLSADVTPVQLGLMLFDTDRERGRLDELRRAYFSASPEKRKRLKPDILHQERRILTTALREKAEAQQQTINQIGRLAAQTRGKLKTSDERRLKAAAEKLARLTALQEALDKPDYAPPFFLYRLHFSEVFEKKGGFDIVVANPPYVRGERLGAAKDEFRVTPIYKDVYAGTADLYVYFYARGWHLLRPGGQLAYITSNKYLRANYGRGLRRFLAEKLTLRALIDFGDLPVFEAAAYPCIVIGEKALTPSPSPTGRGEKALTPDPSSIGEGLETQRTGRSSQGEGSEARNEGRYREMASRTLVQIARDLRQRETSAEQVLWECLRDRRLANLKFRRQHPVPQTTYVVDFFCYEHRLVVELDGEIHARQVEADRVRQQALEALGLRVLRFPNEMVFHDLTSVLAAILQTALASPLPEAKEPGTRLASPLPEAKEPGTRLASPLPEG